MASTPRRAVRVPETANASILGVPFPVQVNHCRTPGCANFGVPARTKRGKTGPSRDRDPRYAVISTSKGQEPAIRCKVCNGKGAIRSNAAIAEEIERIAGYARPLEHRFACKTEGCANFGLSIGGHRHLYVKRGYYKTPENPYYQCKACLRRVLVSHKAPRIQAGNQALAADVLSRIANKSPMRRTVEGARLNGCRDYYRIFDFIHRRCREMNGAVTRAFLTGARRLPAEMDIALDSQSLMVNWPRKVQRRTVEMTSCCSVDSASRFILELDVNHDPRFDPFDVNHESAELGHMTRKEAFRRYARFWLAGDEMRSGRTGQRRMGRQAAEQAVGDIQDAFRAANAYDDVAEMEIVPGQGPLRDTMLRSGMLMKTGYRTLGHMFVLREILKGAGVERLQLSMDQHLSTASPCARLSFGGVVCPTPDIKGKQYVATPTSGKPACRTTRCATVGSIDDGLAPPPDRSPVRRRPAGSTTGGRGKRRFARFPVIEDRKEAAHRHDRSALRRERGNDQRAAFLPAGLGPDQQGSQPGAVDIAHTLAVQDQADRAARDGGGDTPHQHRGTDAVQPPGQRKDHSAIFMALSDLQRGLARFRPAGPRPDCKRGLACLMVIEHGQEAARFHDRPAFGPKRRDGELAAFLHAGSRADEKRTEPGAAYIVEAPAVEYNPAAQTGGIAEFRLERRRAGSVQPAGGRDQDGLAFPARFDLHPRPPPARAAATSSIRRAASTAPGTSVLPTTKAGVPVMPISRASVWVSSI